MKTKEPEVRCQKSENTKINGNFVRIVLVCVLSSVLCTLAAFGGEKWPGVDETVIEKYSKEHGREPHEPLINTDQGDMLLFAFLMAGVAGGFAAGYYWRVLMERKESNK